MLLVLPPLLALGGGVFQLDSHAGVEEETEEEVQYWVTRDIEVGANL